MDIKGDWYDGKTSARTPARLLPQPGGVLEVEREADGAVLFRAAPGEFDSSPRLGDTPRYLTFPGGGKFATLDNEGVDALLSLSGRPVKMGRVNFLEGRLRYVLLSLAVLCLLAAAAVRWGVPWAAKMMANLLPPAAFQMADQQTLKILDKVYLGPSKLAPQDRARLLEQFQPVLDDHPSLNLKILFRQGKRMGPNAFALPGGTIIFTDEMVRLSQHDDELLSVLAHETGHIAHCHAMRTLIQNSFLAFLIMAASGDVSGTSALFIGLPVLFTEMYYSREFEYEADGYARQYLNRKGIPLEHFTNLMLRLDRELKGKRVGDESELTSYLSSHPRMQERLKVFEESR